MVCGRKVGVVVVVVVVDMGKFGQASVRCGRAAAAERERTEVLA